MPCVCLVLYHTTCTARASQCNMCGRVRGLFNARDAQFHLQMTASDTLRHLSEPFVAPSRSEILFIVESGSGCFAGAS